MSPMTIVWSPAAWNAAHDVRPWNGCISAPSLTIPRSPRGTLTFAMPFFTSGVRPVILAMSAASGSTAPALLAVTTARSSSGATRTIVFMVSLPSLLIFRVIGLRCGPPAPSTVRLAGTVPTSSTAWQRRSRAWPLTLRPSVAFPRGEERVERIVEERRLLDGLVVIVSDQWETLGDRRHSGGLRCQADLIGKVGAANDMCERAERRVAGTVLVNQSLERTTPHVVDVGIGGTRRIKPRCSLAALDFRNVLRIDEQECGRGIDEPANEPSRRGAVHTDLLARHPLHADSLRLLREPRAERANHASVDLVPVDVRRRQGDPERRSASLCAVQIDPPAVRFDRPASDGQPETCPAEITRSGLVDSVEAIEDTVAMVWWYAGPGVDDLDGWPGSSVSHDDPDASAGRRVLDGVVHQVDQRLPDHEAIHAGSDWSRRFDGERLLLLLSEHTEMPRDVASQLGEIDALARERHVAPVGADRKSTR